MNTYTEAHLSIAPDNKGIIQRWSQQVAAHDLKIQQQGGTALHRVQSLVAAVAGGLRDIVNATSDRRPLACQPGCHYCCYLQVTVSELEAQAIAQHWVHVIGIGPSFLLLAALQKRLARVATLQDTSDYLRAQLPCLLLEGGRCSIYEIRPTGCQGWHSLRLQACEDGQAKPVDTIPLIAEYLALPGMVLAEVLTRDFIKSQQMPNIGEMTAMVFAALRDELAQQLAQEA